MEITTYNAVQLGDFIRSEEFRTMPVIPISTPRAISHIHNPRAEPNDVLLIIAREGGRMVGYLGVLPDKIYNEKGEAFRCGWLSCMWVDPEVRGKGIAKKLIGTAFDTWSDHILVTEFTPEAKGLYDRSGHFNALRTNDGLRCYLRFNLHEVLPKKNERYKKFKRLLSMADALANVPINVRLNGLSPLCDSTLRFESVDSIGAAIGTLIGAYSSSGFERRSSDELEWIRRYPWLTTGTGEEAKKYHFSVNAERFENLFIKIMDGTQLRGFMHLALRDNHLKVPYAYLPDDILPDVLAYIYDLMIRTQASMLTVFHPAIVRHLQQHKSPFIYKRRIQRNYIITKTLDAHFADHVSLQIQDGDADCAFT
ncbi:MAG: GNAT family N-acetyltransferase [Bacteroidetes bacterium]|nr:GNAT family N-acetyltransferase [Bacteroidota bacterium]